MRSASLSVGSRPSALDFSKRGNRDGGRPQMNRIACSVARTRDLDPNTGRQPGGSGRSWPNRGSSWCMAGASVGIMGELAYSVQEHGGHVTGSFPSSWSRRKQPIPGFQTSSSWPRCTSVKSQMATCRMGHRPAGRHWHTGSVLRDLTWASSAFTPSRREFST